MAETSNLEALKKSITEKAKGGLTTQELSALRAEISCLSDAQKVELRQFFSEQIAEIQGQTQTDLDSLLSSVETCQSTSEKSPESTSSFDRVFTGTRSTAFSEANRQKVQKGVSDILNLKNYPLLTATHRENILLAMTDRLLKDKDFQAIFSTSMGFADIANNLTKGSVVDVADSVSKMDVKKDVLDLEGRIALCIVRVTEPLKKLLEKEKDTPHVLAFLSNPQSIATYDGGEMPTGTQQITKENLESYIQSLGGQIQKIDQKIFPLETMRERGMDLLANGPSMLTDIFRWLLELPFIGKLFAGFLGYKDQVEAITGLDEELQQRKSLSILREFGKATSIEGGQSKDGKYTGKIDILKGKDVSKIDRKNLKPFFQFTREEVIETGTPDFWIGVFEKGKITIKGKDEKEDIVHNVDIIKEDDLKEDFKGLYAKLNKLHDIIDEKKRKEYSEQQTKLAVATPVSTPTIPIVPVETSQTPITPTEINKLTALQKLTSEERKQIIIGNPRDWGMIFPKITDLSDIPKISKDVATIDEFCKNNPAFMKALRKESGKTIVTLEDFWKHKDKAIVAANKLPSTTPVAVIASAPTIPVQQVQTPEVQKDDKILLAEEFKRADRLPFEYGPDKKQVKFEYGRLKIGKKEFALKIALAGDSGLDVLGIGLVGPEVKLEYLVTSANVSREKIIEGIPGLLEMTTGSKNEIIGEKGKLIITRMA